MVVLLSFSRGRRAARAALLSLALIGASNAAANADPPGPAAWLYDRMATTPLERGQFFIGFTASGGAQHLPRFNGTQSFRDIAFAGFPSLGATSFSPDVLGIQPGGEIGYVFRDGTFPAFLGSRVRAAVYGSTQHFESTDSQSNRPNGLVPSVNFFHVSGSFAGFVPFTPSSSFAETLRIKREGFQIGLKLESDIALGPNLSLTPAVAVFGGYTFDRYTHTSVMPNFVPGVFDAVPTQLDERLRTREFGGHLGARLTWQFLPGWALHAGGTAGPVWLSTRLSATDCVNFLLVTPGTPCGPGPATFTSSASDSRSALGFRGTASLGLAVDARIAVISLGGFARYDSRIPGVQNPQSIGNFTAPLAPARVRFDDGFAYGGFLTLRVPLPH